MLVAFLAGQFRTLTLRKCQEASGIDMARFREFCSRAQSPWLWLMGSTVVAAIVGHYARGLWALSVFAAAPVMWLALFIGLAGLASKRDQSRDQPPQPERSECLRGLREPRCQIGRIRQGEQLVNRGQRLPVAEHRMKDESAGRHHIAARVLDLV